jgi:hypothetical protein
MSSGVYAVKDYSKAIESPAVPSSKIEFLKE